MNLSFPLSLGSFDLIQWWRVYTCVCMCLTTDAAETQTQIYDIIFNWLFKLIHTKQLFTFHTSKYKVTHHILGIRGPFYHHGSPLIAILISNYIHHKVWGEIIFPFADVNGFAVEVWEWISNRIPKFTVYVFTYPCLWSSFSMKVKGPKINVCSRCSDISRKSSRSFFIRSTRWYRSIGSHRNLEQNFLSALHFPTV